VLTHEPDGIRLIRDDGRRARVAPMTWSIYSLDGELTRVTDGDLVI